MERETPYESHEQKDRPNQEEIQVLSSKESDIEPVSEAEIASQATVRMVRRRRRPPRQVPDQLLVPYIPTERDAPWGNRLLRAVFQSRP